MLEMAVPPGGKVITVSDLHLPPVRTDVSGRSCATLARHLAEEPGPLTVVLGGDVIELLAFPEATATDILRAHEDLCARRAGKQRLYGLDARELRPVHEWTGGFERFWNESFDRLDAYVQDLKQARQEE